MQNNDLKQIYSNLIAGRLPVGSGSAIKVVLNQAYAILGTNRLHAYCIEKAGFVYYFVIESRFLTSAPDFLLPFVDVLPDGPQYKGDAIYLLNGVDFSAALLLEGGSVRLLCNDIDVLKDYLIGLDLRIIEIEHNGGGKLTSVPQAIQGMSEKLGVYMTRVSLGVLAVSTLVFVGIQSVGAFNYVGSQPRLNASAVESDLNATLKQLSIQQPLARQLSRIQKVSATVIRSGGWIESYTVQGEKIESFEVILPSWVSQDYLDSLGRDVITDLRDIEGLLSVRKLGKKE